MTEYKVNDEIFSCWTEAQDYAVELLYGDVEYVSVLVWDETYKHWGLLQELNLERGILPDPHFNTWSLAPYYVKLRNL